MRTDVNEPGPPADEDGIRILHVDDDHALLDLTAHLLERENAAFQVVTVETADAGISALTADEFDCVVSDYDMPGTDGIEFLGRVRRRDLDLPFILFTGKGSEEIASEAISAGVTDYLQKETGTEQYAMLAKRVENAVERHRAEAELERERRRYELIGRASADAFWDLDTESGTVERSDGFARLFGYDDEAVGDGHDWWEERLHPEDRERVVEVLDATIERAGDVYEDVYRFRNADGSYSRVISRGFVVHDGDEEPTRVVGTLTDVTDVKRRERALADARSRLELVLEGTGTGVWEWDAETDEVHWDETTRRLLGVDAKDAEGSYERFRSRIHPEDRDRFVHAIEQALREDRQMRRELRIRRVDGSFRWMEVKGIHRLPEGDGRGRITGLVSDVTGRKEHERALKRYETIVEASGDAVYTLDEEGRYTFVNQAHTDVVGYEAEEMIGEHVSLVADEEDLRRGNELIRELLARDVRRHDTFDVTLHTKSGDEVVAENHIGLLTDEDGEFRGTVGIVRDLTERKERERRVEALHEATRRLIRAGSRKAVANLTAEAAKDVLGHVENTVRLLEDDDRLVPYAITGAMRDRVGDRPVYRVGQEPVGLAFAEDETLVYEDAETIDDGIDRSTGANMYVPIGGHGVMTISHTEVGSLDESDVQLASLLSANAATAIERIQQVETRRERERELRQREQALSSLHDATRRLLEAETKAEVAALVAETARDILGYPRSSVRLRSADGRQLVPAAAAGLDNDERTAYPADKGPSGKVLAKGEPVVFDDLSEFGSDYSASPVESMMVLPIGDHGALAVADDGSGEFDEAEQRLASILTANAENVLDRVEHSRGLKKQNERLEQFANVMSHDLRNPLNVAMGRVEMLREECESDHLDAVEKALSRMTEIIGDVLSLARSGEAVLEPDEVPIGPSVDAAWEITDPESATLYVDDDPGTILADGTRLTQLLGNLFGNAIEHGGPDVTVHVGRIEGEDRSARGFYVEDDGPGISEDDRERVFEWGYSTTTAGTGFGLAIVSEIVDAHGWDVAVVEGESGGARFEITGADG